MNTSAVAQLTAVGVHFPVGDSVVPALSDVSLTIESGTSTAIVGRSGSGKSTLTSVLALLRRPTTGTVTIGGIRATELSDAAVSHLRSRFVGTVFQSFHLEPSFTAEENAMLPWYFGANLSRREARIRARELLDVIDIADLAERRPSQMSGGQRQRVAIARALFMRPALLIADEPTGNLDEETASIIAETLFDLPRNTSTAVIVVTHDSEIADRAERCIRLVRGQLAEGEV